MGLGRTRDKAISEENYKRFIPRSLSALEGSWTLKQGLWKTKIQRCTEDDVTLLQHGSTRKEGPAGAERSILGSIALTALEPEQSRAVFTAWRLGGVSILTPASNHTGGETPWAVAPIPREGSS
ncbi:hypothetical protein Y1Q_0009832 [Alligator mississippiensis]|uniref:Uncharacterized protein n=1 Tax=Alligator mississippiensis TaxID=8496 RepID=A0A151MX73_ALLMI|nr:hypothetical protein Y1Q_0009832 [Alligator mississippiensis]